MSRPPAETLSEQPLTHHDIDAISLRMLGVFFGVLGLCVCVGTFWALARPAAAAINVGAGGLLLLIGGGMFYAGGRVRRAALARQARKP